MPKIDEKVYSVVKSAKTIKFVDYAKEYLNINRQLDELNTRKKAIGSYFLRSFEGKDFKTYKIDEDLIGITKVEPDDKISFNYKKLYEEHPELIHILDQYKSSKPVASYVKIYSYVETKDTTYTDISSAINSL